MMEMQVRIAEYKNGLTTYRDATPEEIAEMERQRAEMPEPEPTPEERLAELEAQNQILTQCLMEMSQIVYA